MTIKGTLTVYIYYHSVAYQEMVVKYQLFLRRTLLYTHISNTIF